MTNVDNSNNFIVQPPKLSWLSFAYHQDMLNDIKITKESLKNEVITNDPTTPKNKGLFRSWKTDEQTDSRSQSFIELTKLLSDDCQYGLMDEYAGTEQEREEIKKQRELKKIKEEEEKRDREIAAFEAKLREEYRILDNETVENQNNNEGVENKSKTLNVIAIDDDNNEEIIEVPPQLSLTSSLERLNINDINKNNITRMPFSAPVKSNMEETRKQFGLSNTSLEKLNRRNSFDQYVIRLNEPLPDGSPHKIASIRPIKNVAILSNNYITSIDFKKPNSGDADSRLIKDFLDGVYPKNGENGEEEEENHAPDYSNRIEKFKMTGESSSSLNILLENVDIKCSSYNERFPRNTSSESLESIDFRDEIIDQNVTNNESWFSSLSKSFQSWMNQKNDPDYERYFTTTDKYGNVHVMPVKTIMHIYNIDFEQATSIHDYVCSIMPKFPNNITSYTKYVEDLNINSSESRENRTLELTYKNHSISPIITSDLALKLQAQLPMNLHSRTKWTMQYSLASSGSTKETSNNLSQNKNNLIDLINASKNNGPCLLIIQDDNNYVFGMFSNEELHNDNDYFGTRAWFLWKYKNSELEVYRPDGLDDTNLLLCNSDALSVGGVYDSDYALYLDKRKYSLYLYIFYI